VTRGLLLTAAALTTLLAPCGALAARAAEPPTASMVQEALRGGVPEALPAAGPVRLTLQDAIARGLQHNLAAVLADAGLRGARGARLEALAGVLPSLSAGLSASRQIISLEEFGFPVAPGESPLIGPFEVVRGQLDLTETIGWGAIEHARAGGDRLSAARESQRDVRELVVTAVARSSVSSRPRTTRPGTGCRCLAPSACRSIGSWSWSTAPPTSGSRRWAWTRRSIRRCAPAPT
jgi:outer membrane protein TolC